MRGLSAACRAADANSASVERKMKRCGITGVWLGGAVDGPVGAALRREPEWQVTLCRNARSLPQLEFWNRWELSFVYVAPY